MPSADPDVEAAVEQVIERADLLGKPNGMVKGQEVHERPQADLARRLRCRREEQADLRHRVERDHVVLGLEVVGEARVIERANQLEPLLVELTERRR